MKKVVFVFAFLLPVLVIGQIRKVQWATEVLYQYNEDSTFSGPRILGAPDAFPPGHLNYNAFRLDKEAAFGTIKVGFEKPQFTQQVVIIESNLPGRVSQVKLIDEYGFNYIIYQQDPVPVPDKFRTMILSIPKTDYRVKAIEVNLNSIPCPGYSQIDAIGIIEEANMADVRNILAGANFNVQQIMTFTSNKEPLDGWVNSRYAEAKPLISYDGNTLFFSRMYHPENTTGRSDPQDIYFSKHLNTFWSAAENIGFPLNDQFANGVCSISPDGNKLLVNNAYRADGTVEPGVSVSVKTATGWSRPRKLEIEDFENYSQFQDFFISADERVILMAVQRHDGLGDQDLYVSVKNGPESYSKPVNLGNKINTNGAEFAPFLAADNSTLYFSSNGHGGYGDCDIFKTRRLDTSWQNWSEPQNLGPAVNTSSWEAYFSITAAGDFAYFVSSEGDRHNTQNIYKISLLQPVKPESTENLLAFQGRVFDAITQEPLSSQLIIENVEQKKPYRTMSDEITGNFLLYLPKGADYEFTVRAPGYITFFDLLDLKSTQGEESLFRNIYLTPIKPEQVFILNNLLFEQSKPILLEDSYQTLEKLITILNENPEMKIQLAGHTDAYGPSKSKEVLSYRRVEKIKEYLVQYGIDKKRIETVGYGGAKPIAPNDTEENRSKNRRVEIKVLDVGS